MVPTKILDKAANEGALFLGGFKAAINKEFLKKEKITHIVNAAGKALGMMFGPKYRVGILGIYFHWKSSLITLEYLHSYGEQLLVISNKFSKGSHIM